MAINWGDTPHEWYSYKTAIMLNPQDRLRVGMWDIGFVGYDYTSAAPRGCRHVAYIMLPGLPQTQGYYGTVREAKGAVEKAAAWWFYHLENHEELQPQIKRVSRTRGRSEPARVRRTRTTQAVPVSRARRAPRAL